MYIDDKYFLLTGLLIYDKRAKMSGMICGITISVSPFGNVICYEVDMKGCYGNQIFIPDIENGNIVFLLPFKLYPEEDVKRFEEMSKAHEERIRKFFGENFREDMVMRVNEDDRKRRLQEFEEFAKNLWDWDMILRAREEIERDE